jgi:hypothetical protein
MQQINNLLDEEGNTGDNNLERVGSEISEEGTYRKLKQEKDPITKFLRQVPPDFRKAEIHGVTLNFS